jgi:hypothetical protein
MNADLLIAFLRLVLVASLYLFLIVVIVALARDVGRQTKIVSPPAPAGRASPRTRLLVVDAKQTGLPEAFEIDGEAVIGRDPSAAVHLPPQYVSGRHARLEFANGRWWIEDLGSRNRTYLNGDEVPVGQPVPASPGDEIVVAGIRLRLDEP